MNQWIKNKALLVLVFPLVSLAQDIHFSQSFASPLYLNPATSGNFSGKFRFNCNYKDQWRSVSKPYKTFYVAADYAAFRKKKTGNYLGIGLSFYNDKTGASFFSTNEATLSLAYTIKVNKYQFFSAGLGVGFGQKSFHINGLKWDSQFNGATYDASLATGEPIYNQRVSYLDFSAGLLWNIIPDTKHKVTIGASIFHLNKPNQSFSTMGNDPLNPKIVIHAHTQLKIGQKNSSVVPMFLYTNQGLLKEITLGGMLKYDLGLESKYTGFNKTSYVSFGGFYRVKDAFIILLSLDYKQTFNFGFSYDVNTSSLISASKGRGGIELHVGYTSF